MEKRIVTLGLVQMSMTDSAEANLQKASKMTEEAVKKGANIVVLPELFLGPYFCINEKNESEFDRAQEIPGLSTEGLGALAKRLKIVLIAGSIYEVSKGKRYNTACVFGQDGELIGTYRKAHIPHDPGFYEQNYFGSGNETIKVHDTPFGKIAVGICYDQWFPEFARIATLNGAELLVYPTAIGNAGNVTPVDPSIPEDWETMWRSAQVGHAPANCVYVAAVNRVGDEGKTHFFGGSFVADPNARILCKGDDTEQVLMTTIDLSYPKKMQESWRFLRERRPDLYGDLTKKL
ncbi:MAG: nitrilase-related carbon-nitrogen hydrolase [Candidatus Peribacteraceae bacterium]